MIFSPPKIAVLPIAMLLTACTPPNYAPVKVVNQSMDPYDTRVPATQPGRNQDKTDEQAISPPEDSNNSIAKQQPSVNNNEIDFRRNQQEQATHQSKNQLADNAVTTTTTKQRAKYENPRHFPEKTLSQKNSNLSSQNAISNVDPKKQNPVSTSNRQPLNSKVTPPKKPTSPKNSPQQNAKIVDKSPTTKKNHPDRTSSISIDNKKMLKLNFDWPIWGKISKNFIQTGNKGVDIASKTGGAVHAAEAGKVVYCGQGLAGFGNLIIIKHNQTYLTAYANNSKLHIKEGQQVKKSQTIAQVSATASKKPLLHFEIREHGKPVNPLKLLPER